MALSSWLKNALRKLLAGLKGQLSKEQESPESLSTEYTKLSRFIFDRRHFSPRRKMAKPTAFTDPTSRTSAFWIDELRETEIWTIGDQVAGAPRRRAAKARADFKSADVLESGLSIEPDPAPHPRHVELCGWPTDKDEILAIAQELCVRSSLRIREESA